MAFTYFFRDRQTLDLIVQHALPVMKSSRFIRIWDAGCAHGPEPYSLAILLRENMSHFLFRNVQIYATDIDNSDQFGDIIGKGLYPEEELKRIPGAIFEKYFSKNGAPGKYQIAEEIKAHVSFSRHDLLTLEPIRSGFGLVVCKNVLLHFSRQQREDVLRMFHAVLRESGFLVMEHTQKLPQELAHLFQQVTSDGQLYRKVGKSP